MQRVLLAIILTLLATSAQALSLRLISHYSSQPNGNLDQWITDGSHTSGIAGATIATWDWDGTTLSGSGLYSAVMSVSSNPAGPVMIADQVTDLSMDMSTGTASATAYSCLEGTFFPGIGASGCGGYTFEGNFVDDSNSIWGPGTAFSQTLGGDDLTWPTEVFNNTGQRSIAAYDFSHFHVAVLEDFNSGPGHESIDWTTLVIGNGVALSSAGSNWMCFQNDWAPLIIPDPGCEAAIAAAVAPVPVPAAVWLFGSALGLLAWRKKSR